MKIDIADLQKRLFDLKKHFERCADQNRTDGMRPYAIKSEGMAEGVDEAIRVVRHMARGR